jgi:serine/threonine protein kinase
LGLKCPRCLTENTAESKFCRECAAPLGGNVPDSQESAASSPKINVSKTLTLETKAETLGRGTVFSGRYEILEELGGGGMGKVFRVYDRKLEEEVALKLIRAEIGADRKAIERFKNELKVARKIAHKNICKMYDLGESEGASFITMEYVRGEDLKSLIHRTKALTVGTSVSIARQVAEGLSEAHKLGIVHRDLKPGNIMIDKEGSAKIMDFGIARSLLGKGLTGEGAIIGTPEYMSPEQVEGKEADQRSDIYALGVILFEMLVGSPPFEGETPFSIANKHKTEPPPVPKKLLPQIPEELNRLILRCLEKDRATRYQTAEELVADLSAIERFLPSADRALTRAKTKIRTSREITVKLTPKRLIIPAAIIIFLALAALALIILFKPGVSKIDSLAVLPLADLSAKKDEGFSVEGIHDALINELCKIPAVNVIARQSVMRFLDSKEDVPGIARELKAAGIVEGSVIQTKDTVRITVSLLDGRDGKRLWGPKSFDRKPTDILSLYSDVALTIAREIDAKLAVQNIGNLTPKPKVDPEAYNLYYQAMYGGWQDGPISMEQRLKKKVELLQQAIGIDPGFAPAHALAAMVLQDLAFFGFYTPRSEALLLARQSAEKAVLLDESLPEAHEALGSVKFNLDWNFDGFLKEYQRAMELAPGRTVGSWVTNLALLGHFDEALDLLRRMSEANPLYPADPTWTLLMARRFDEVIAGAQKRLEVDPNDWYARMYLSIGYAFREMCAEAIVESEKVLSGMPGVESDANVLYQIAFNFAHCGNRKKAEELHEAFNKTGIANSDPTVLAWNHAQLGEKDLALDALEKGLEIRSPYLVYLKVDPMLDPLRDEPRFKELLKKVGFER